VRFIERATDRAHRSDDRAASPMCAANRAGHPVAADWRSISARPPLPAWVVAACPNRLWTRPTGAAP